MKGNHHNDSQCFNYIQPFVSHHFPRISPFIPRILPFSAAPQTISNGFNNLTPMCRISETLRVTSVIPSTAAVAARIDAEEKERLSRDNQLLEQYMNVRFDGEICKGREYKLIDGALWQQAVPRVDWKVRPSLEVICENGFKPTFDRVVIHGTFDPEVGTPWVETWTKDGWLKYGTRSATFERFRREIVLDQRVTSDRFRVVFPGVDHARNDIELYEIEIPKAK